MLFPIVWIPLIWDRIFGTWTPRMPDEIAYGVPEFATLERQRAGFLLRSPFLNVRDL